MFYRECERCHCSMDAGEGHGNLCDECMEDISAAGACLEEGSGGTDEDRSHLHISGQQVPEKDEAKDVLPPGSRK